MNQKQTKKIWCLLFSLVMLLCCGCAEQTAPELLEPVGVKMDAYTVEPTELYDLKSFDFSVVPYTEEICFTTEGKLKSIAVSIGQTVQKGQTIAALDTTALESELEQVQGEISFLQQNNANENELLQIDIDIATLELEQMKSGETAATEPEIRLKESELVQMTQQLSQQKSQQQLALSQKKSLAASLQGQISQATLTAPFTGEVTYLADYQTGAPIPAYTPVVCLSDSSRLSLSGEYINEPLLDQASEIYAQVGGTLYPITYAPLSDAEHSAIALGGLTLFTQFTFNGSTEGLQSGQYACVYVKYNQASQVLAVPINALYQDETGPYVYRIIQGKQTRTEVQTGIETALQIEITAGLQEGDVVFVKN